MIYLVLSGNFKGSFGGIGIEGGVGGKVSLETGV
jgi:hypothetical protein